MPIKSPSLAWLITILLALLDAGWLFADHLTITANSLITAAVFVGVMLILNFIYTRLRPDERLAVLTDQTVKFMAFSFCLGVFGYLLVGFHRPLIDGWLDAADRTVGFDWPAIYAWVMAHPAAKLILMIAYNSVIPQIGILIMLMVTLRRYDRAQLLLWFYIVASLTYIAISGLLPAAGAFGYYKTALDTPYIQQFYQLRSGTMTVLDLLKLQGVVQFPSFHLALAVICAYVTKGMRVFPFFRFS